MLQLELAILHQQQQGLEHRDGEQAVGQDRQQDVRENAGLRLDQLGGAGRRKLREQHGQQAEREKEQQQVVYRDALGGQQQCGDHGRSDQAGGAEEVQGQAGGREQLLEQAGAMGQEGQDAKQGQQGARRCGALAEAQGLVGGGAGVKTGGDEAGQQRLHRSV